MSGIDGATVGRWSLRLDAAYCAVLGTVVAVCAGPIAAGVGVASPLVVVAGVTVVVWAGAVLWMLSRLPLRVALRSVMAALPVKFHVSH